MKILLPIIIIGIAFLGIHVCSENNKLKAGIKVYEVEYDKLYGMNVDDLERLERAIVMINEQIDLTTNLTNDIVKAEATIDLLNKKYISSQEVIMQLIKVLEAQGVDIQYKNLESGEITDELP